MVTESNNTVKGTIIHLHGLPGSPYSDFSNLHKLLAIRGYRILSYNYPGLWNQPGTFSLDNSVGALKEVYNYCIENYGKSLFFFAESFGATVAVYAGFEAITPSKIFYRAPLPGIQYFTSNPQSLRQLQSSLAMLISAGIMKIEENMTFMTMESKYNIESEFHKVFSELHKDAYSHDMIFIGKNDEIIDWRKVEIGFDGSQIHLVDNLSHNNISREQWIELVTRMDIFFQS